MGFFSRKKKPESSVVIENAIDDSQALLAEMSRLSGVTDPDQAMRISAVSVCIRVLSESVAMLPCETYRMLPDGGREKAKDLRIYDVLKYQPNPWMNAYQFWELVVKTMLLSGSFYASQTRVGGELRELVDFPANALHPHRDESNRFSYKVAADASRSLSPEKVFHVADALKGDGSLVGQSRIQQSSQMLGKIKSAEAWSKAVFDEFGVPPGFLATEQDLTESQRNEIRDYFKGLVGIDQGEGKKGIPVLTKGLKYVAPSISFADAQILDALKFSREEVCAIYRVPPHIAQFYEKTTSWGTGIEQVALQFVSFTLLPILRRLELAISTQLLTRRERQTLQVQFNVTSLLRGDMKARAEFYYKALLMGWMSINDVRRLENLNPVPGGDSNRVPSNTEDLLKMMRDENQGATE